MTSVQEAGSPAWIDPAPAITTRKFGNFSAALDWMKMGLKVQRECWTEYGPVVAVWRPTELDKMTQPYAYITNSEASMIPWTPTQGDLFANDWRVVL